METAVTEMTNEMELGLQKYWSRRLTGANIYDDDISELLQDSEVFPSAQVEDVTSSQIPCCPTLDEFFNQDLAHHLVPKCKIDCDCSSEVKSLNLNGQDINDIPAIYKISEIKKHEFPAIGIYVDPRIVPGFKYRVRPCTKGCQEKWLFGPKALELETIGRGYSRRITFKADKGCLNDNSYYFWADSRPEGYAFELEVISSGDKFTIFDANKVPVGTLEILLNQAPQEEIGHRVRKDGCVEKTVRIKVLCKVEWYDDDNSELIVPVIYKKIYFLIKTLQLHGVAVSVRSKSGLTTKVIGASVGHRRGFTLRAGINNRLRSTRVRGESIADVPTAYTIAGLEEHELPVVGTYVDPRIMVGFHYKVCPAAGKRRPLFNGRPLKLVSIGMGYGKRITFEPDTLNNPDNYFWSDSHPDGLGFEPIAVRPGMAFDINAGELHIGKAHVYRADAPQQEIKQEMIMENGKITIIKHIHVEMTCTVELNTRCDKTPVPHTMRVFGNAVISKRSDESEAVLLRVENIGLDSQLNILFSTQWDELVFHPTVSTNNKFVYE